SPARVAPERSAQQHDRAVNFVRVLLPPGERPGHTVNGWPASFTRRVGRGKVVFTTLGPRAWYRGRQARDAESPYLNYPTLPVAGPPSEDIAKELQPRPEEDTLPVESVRALLAEDIGYSVPGRSFLVPLFAGSLSVALLLCVVLRKSRRLELVGWLVPLAAI